MAMWRRDDADRAWRPAEKEFAIACEAFVSGRYAQFLDDRGRPAPEWAWLNVLAHGGRTTLEAIAAGERWHCFLATNTRIWEDALSFLAGEILQTAPPAEAGLAALQRDVLIPLELSLIRSRPRYALGPTHLARAVTEALDHYRATPGRTRG
ncbi:MAG TPA: hypothetical protein VEI83_16770 [Acidimicrobiales bacterium]|nr:hypothetical protein [Acidimicrobiales bacterium]